MRRRKEITCKSEDEKLECEVRGMRVILTMSSCSRNYLWSLLTDRKVLALRVEKIGKERKKRMGTFVENNMSFIAKVFKKLLWKSTLLWKCHI